MTQYDKVRAIVWENETLSLLDQRRLPEECHYLVLETVRDVAGAIRDMVVRGAPAIGVTAAYGVVIAARARYQQSPHNWQQLIEQDLESLARARPTAINLVWAIARMRTAMQGLEGDPVVPLLVIARAIHKEDIDGNRRMGELGAAYIDPGSGVITHCNTGGLATGGYGTALGVIRSAYAANRIQHVYADETRPWLQGARLTAWELVQEGIPVSLLVDGAAAWLMAQGKVQWAIVGSDRIAANGDVANKIGTYHLAVAARHHGVKMMVVAPTSTIAMDTATGADIPIETRSADEIHQCGGSVVAALGADAWNPVFDVTPADLVDVLVTEKGVLERPGRDNIAALTAL